MLTDTDSTAGGLCIKLRDMNNPEQCWDVGLFGEVIVGRDEACQIYLNDKTVSRHQCRLYQGADGVPAAENISTTNMTKLNGAPLDMPRKIVEGDKLKCGQVTLIVESVYDSQPGNINKMTEFVNV